MNVENDEYEIELTDAWGGKVGIFLWSGKMPKVVEYNKRTYFNIENSNQFLETISFIILEKDRKVI